MGHFFSKVSLFIDKKEAAAHLILDQDFATAPYFYLILYYYISVRTKSVLALVIVMLDNYLVYIFI